MVVRWLLPSGLRLQAPGELGAMSWLSSGLSGISKAVSSLTRSADDRADDLKQRSVQLCTLCGNEIPASRIYEHVGVGPVDFCSAQCAQVGQSGARGLRRIAPCVRVRTLGSSCAQCPSEARALTWNCAR